MTYESVADGGLDYFPCRYGKSKLLFRGPRRSLEGDYVAVLGGTETYGKFVERPYPELLEQQIGCQIVNFGTLNAGVDVFLGDDTVLEACAGAKAVVLQVLGAQNLSNRLYTVHPRRSDRFLKASSLLRMRYPDMEFTEIHFTRHLIRVLHQADPKRFEEVRSELQSAWLGRMMLLLRKIRRPVLLLWMGPRRPEDPVDLNCATDPLFVDGDMIGALGSDIAGLIDATPGAAALATGRQGMVFSDFDAPAASEVPNLAVHRDTARLLAPAVRRFL